MTVPPRRRPQARGIEDWPEQRREALLWRFAFTLGYDGADDYVRAEAAEPCLIPGWWAPDAKMTAVLGDDGRGGHIPHQRQCSRWTDGTIYLMFAPMTASDEQQRAPHQRHTVDWLVELLGERVDPATVPPLHRCTFVGGRTHWPPYLSGESRMGRIRQQLVDLAGPLCHACGRTIGVVIDHDHFTGLARGLLCSICNAWIDICPHLQGCPRADCLNNPPATHLQLRHPRAHRDRKRHRAHRVPCHRPPPCVPVVQPQVGTRDAVRSGRSGASHRARITRRGPVVTGEHSRGPYTAALPPHEPDDGQQLPPRDSSRAGKER